MTPLPVRRPAPVTDTGPVITYTPGWRVSLPLPVTSSERYTPGPIVVAVAPPTLTSGFGAPVGQAPEMSGHAASPASGSTLGAESFGVGL